MFRVVCSRCVQQVGLVPPGAHLPQLGAACTELFVPATPAGPMAELVFLVCAAGTCHLQSALAAAFVQLLPTPAEPMAECVCVCVVCVTPESCIPIGWFRLVGLAALRIFPSCNPLLPTPWHCAAPSVLGQHNSE
jgi:hypothetical protein